MHKNSKKKIKKQKSFFYLGYDDGDATLSDDCRLTGFTLLTCFVVELIEFKCCVEAASVIALFLRLRLITVTIKKNGKNKKKRLIL